jgi:hypothetical protein
MCGQTNKIINIGRLVHRPVVITMYGICFNSICTLFFIREYIWERTVSVRSGYNLVLWTKLSQKSTESFLINKIKGFHVQTTKFSYRLRYLLCSRMIDVIHTTNIFQKMRNRCLFLYWWCIITRSTIIQTCVILSLYDFICMESLDMCPHVAGVKTLAAAF